MLRARMRGGLLAKARRGELQISLPVGFVYDELGRVVLHPDAQVRDTIALFFRTFLRTGSAGATVKHFSEQAIPFPAPARSGGRTAQVLGVGSTWGGRCTSCTIPDTPVPSPSGTATAASGPAGAIARRASLRRSGTRCCSMPTRATSRGRSTSASSSGCARRRSPTGSTATMARRARARPSCRGRVVCGRCGVCMSVRYHRRQGRLVPDYVCCVRTLQHRDPTCQVVPGGTVDAAVAQLLIEAMTPMALDLTLAVQAELETRLHEADRLRGRQIERAEHEAEHARRRYMHGDPTNRLVAASLEADWNDKLRALDEVRDEVERQLLGRPRPLGR